MRPCASDAVKPTARTAGWSLLELLAVLALLGSVLVVVAPRTAQRTPEQDRLAVEAIVRDLDARARAQVALGRQASLNVREGQLVLTDGNSEAVAMRPLPEGVTASVSSGSRDDATRDRQPVEFRPGDLLGHYVVHVQNDSGTSELRVSRATGAIEVVRP